MAGISDFMSIFGDNSGAYGDAGDEFDRQAQKYNSWINRGNQAGDMSMEQYVKLVNDPDFLQNRLSQDYQQSPYQKSLQDQVTRRMNMNAAISGMIQSPVAQDALNKEINTQTGQFLNDYVNRGMQSYGMGLSGLQDTSHMGLNALNSQGNMVSQGIGSRLAGSISSNNAMSNMLGFGTGVAMHAFGGPAAGAMGAAGPGVSPTSAFGQSGIPYASGSPMGGQNPYSSSYSLGGY